MGSLFLVRCKDRHYDHDIQKGSLDHRRHFHLTAFFSHFFKSIPSWLVFWKTESDRYINISFDVLLILHSDFTVVILHSLTFEPNLKNAESTVCFS